jgi:hypothetical protein
MICRNAADLHELHGLASVTSSPLLTDLLNAVFQEKQRLSKLTDFSVSSWVDIRRESRKATVSNDVLWGSLLGLPWGLLSLQRFLV